MYNDDDLINEVLEVTDELGKVPTRDEFLKHNAFRYGNRHVYTTHGSYRNLLTSAGLKEPMISGKTNVTCNTCSKLFVKNNSDIAKTNHNFCSHGCSASFSNKTRAKPTLVKYCTNCSDEYINKYRDVTRTCSGICRMEKNMKSTIISDKINNSGANTYDKIRHNARRYSKYFYPKYCMNCGYNKHYEVCHVKDLKDFDRDSTMYDTNQASNLIHLCCNCHWEFDNNMITVDDIRTLQSTHKL